MPKAMSIITRSSLFVSIILFLLRLLNQTITLAQSNSYHHFCDNNTKLASADNSLYQSNLKDLLLEFLSNAIIEGQGFWNTTRTTVYGSYLCRDDFGPIFCHYCVYNARKEILWLCPNKTTSAIIWHEDCMLRYSNEDFFGIVRATPFWYVYSVNPTADSRKVKNVDDFTELLVANATMDGSRTLYAANEFSVNDEEKWYGLVQCSRDINSSSCRNCLESLLNTRPEPKDRLGMMLLAPNCLVIRDSYPFFNHNSSSVTTVVSPVPDPAPSPAAPSPPVVSPVPYPAPSPGAPSPLASPGLMPNPGRKKGAERSMIMIFISVAVTLVAALSACCYCLRRRNRNDGQQITTDLVLHNHHEFEDSLKADLPMMPLSIIKQCTNDFSDEFKLGRGGFGSVYKTWRLWNEGRALVVMDQILETSGTPNEVVKCINIGLLCVQEDAADRPSMPNIALMLSSDMVNLPNPKKPAFSVGREVVQQEQLVETFRHCSTNEVTISDFGPR
ncbi:hypothetical protein L6164_023231 [Bauhinia variegata]|uniref:Uncharacterized protein n=1 Tax=Bauhinia variegata TaxID=167791 RepID=A0ACB9MJ45_BAUVA|nr:hypothetical protein L6164_023231 [Bauhinia variegata]